MSSSKSHTPAVKRGFIDLNDIMEDSAIFDTDKLNTFKKNGLINSIRELENEKAELKQQLREVPALKKPS